MTDTTAESAENDTVWIIQNPSGSPHAVFATEELARKWLAENPTALADCEAEQWHLHGGADGSGVAPLLAARELVRAAEASGDLPAGWDDNPVHGKPDDPNWAAHREHTCGKCGETFGSNFQPGEVDCPECDARLCSSCGHWEGGSE